MATTLSEQLKVQNTRITELENDKLDTSQKFGLNKIFKIYDDIIITINIKEVKIHKYKTCSTTLVCSEDLTI